MCGKQSKKQYGHEESALHQRCRSSGGMKDFGGVDFSPSLSSLLCLDDDRPSSYPLPRLAPPFYNPLKTPPSGGRSKQDKPLRCGSNEPGLCCCPSLSTTHLHAALQPTPHTTTHTRNAQATPPLPTRLGSLTL